MMTMMMMLMGLVMTRIMIMVISCDDENGGEDAVFCAGEAGCWQVEVHLSAWRTRMHWQLA